MTPLTPEEIAAIHALVETFRQGTDNAESLPELMQAADRLADALTAETQRADDYLVQFRSIEASFGVLDNSPAMDDERALPEYLSARAANSVSRITTLQAELLTVTNERNGERHITETQRVAINILKKKLGEKPRGVGGFGSTDTVAEEAPDLLDAITDEQLADITNGDVKGYLQNLVYILHKLQTERDQLAAEVKRWKGTAEALRQTENAELLLLRQDVAEQAERWGKLREPMAALVEQTRYRGRTYSPNGDCTVENCQCVNHAAQALATLIDSLSVPAEPERQAPAVGAEQAAMLEWFTRNGGKTDIVTAVKRAEKELAELLEAAQAGDIQHVREESADVTLCLMLVATLGEYDLLEAVRWKQAINNARRWRADEYGCLYHIKGSDPRDLRACKNLACQLAGMHTFSCEKEFEHSEAVQSSRPQAHHGRGCRCEECKIENYSLEVPQGAQSGDAAASVSDGGSQKAVERSTEQVLRELQEKIEKCEPSLGGPRVAKLEAQLQAAWKDTERLNWLDSQMDWGNRPDGSLKHGIAAYLGAPKPIREAIDAAISATSKGDTPE